MNSLELQGELAAILFVMTKLSTRFPLLSESSCRRAGLVWLIDSGGTVGYQAAKIQNFLETK